ncbi:MAG: glutathione peroxidase [Candidatus Zixiibacteriota bacterium]
MKFRSFVALAAASALAAGVAATEPVAKKPAGTAEPIDQKQIQGKPDMSASSYLTIPFKTITGHDSTLAAFKGKVVLIVNTASECGYTPQYEGLEQLYEKYKDKGLVVVGFPANNFGGQEPGSNEEIAKFCTSKFSVTFPMMAKVSVKGEDIHPLFKYLTMESSITGEIGWNFNKFLLDKDGELVSRYPSKITPLDPQLTSKIESLF